MTASWLWIFLGLPLATAIAGMLTHEPRLRFALSLAGTAALLAASVVLLSTVRDAGPLSVQASALPAPLAIGLVADKLAAIMLALTAFLAFFSMLYSAHEVAGESAHDYYYPLFQFLLFGLNGVFLAADLFNLYVWFEVLLNASFGLLVLRRDRARIEGAVKYLTLNLLASAMLLIGAGTMYALTGTLNMAAMAEQVTQLDNPVALNAAASLFLIAFGIKSAVFPLYFWLPASYHLLPVSLAAFFAGVMSKVGIYALLRLFTLIFPDYLPAHAPLILTLAALTMISGVLGAIAQLDIRRLLSFHIISQIGYLLLGLGLAGAEGLAASIYFLVHVAITKSALFFITGATERALGGTNLEGMGGLAANSPWLAIYFLIAALSLAGIPPLSGFWGKFLILRAGLNAGAYAVTATAFVVSLLTLYSMTKIWLGAFWSPVPAGKSSGQPAAGDWMPLGSLTVCILLLGAIAEPGIRLAAATAEELLARQPYLQSALGGP